MTIEDPFTLHKAVLAEIRGEDSAALVQDLLASGADPHQTDSNGNTPFNVAAASAPVAGRLMTLHWLSQALEGRGGKGLNDLSGSHGSTLAQYMAKWLTDDELESVFKKAMEGGMKIDVANDSGWTPLTAAAVMGRVAAVRFFTTHYSREVLCCQTTKDYTAKYGPDCEVTYRAGLNALEAAGERALQDENIDEKLGESIWECMDIIAAGIEKK
jgi:ankyrin repeat protein